MNSAHTNTVETESIEIRSNATGKRLTALVGLESLVETSIVAPATDSHTDLDVVIEQSADLLQRLERLVLASRLSGEERRVGKGHHDVGDAVRDVLGGHCLGVPLVIVKDVARTARLSNGEGAQA